MKCGKGKPCLDCITGKHCLSLGFHMPYQGLVRVLSDPMQDFLFCGFRS